MLFAILVVTLASCLTEDDLTNPTSFVPIVVKTTEATAISPYSAIVGGELSAPQSRQATRGVCWGTTPNPIPTETDMKDQGQLGAFSFNLSNLKAQTTYYYRAYATNSKGIVYGTQQTFKTQALAIATIATTAITGITATSATSGGNVTSDGGSFIVTRGICWSTTPNPTITVTTKTSEGVGIGPFTSSMINLQPGVIYYVRAYATNTIGTAYGNQQTFTANNYATISTIAPSNITSTTATSGGNASADGGSSITTRGICWSTTVNPTVANSKTSDGTGTGSFSSSITGLVAGTTYNVRAYCTNSVGVVYGANVTFTTLSTVPVLTTTDVTSIATTTATSGGTISSDGGAAITAKGICWGITANPTITTGSKTTDGTGVGAFSSSLSALSPSTTYYVRAYASNSAGTAYGNQVIFTTSNVLSIPILSTIAASSITTTTANSGGSISSDGGSTVTAKGLCWSTAINPTINDSKTSDGTGVGLFNSVITGLTFGTIYYVRSYAINSLGTAYGAQISFKTLGLAIGQSYQGGVIAYIFKTGDAGYVASQTHGIIAAPSDQSTSIPWATKSSNAITGIAIGTGNANTSLIVGKLGVGSYAAKLCYDLTLGGYSDWYLPSQAEFLAIYQNSAQIGGLSGSYWTSTSSGVGGGAIKFEYSDFWWESINIPLRVRAVRSF